MTVLIHVRVNSMELCFTRKMQNEACLLTKVENVTIIVENTKSGRITMDGDTSEMCVYTIEY